jgi:uncharacterized protein
VKPVPRVLDTYSVIAYLESEPGAKKMIDLFKAARDSGTDLLFCVVNWGEVYYITRRELGPSRAEEVVSLVQSLPIAIIDVDTSLTRIAAEFKSKHRMSYADCFAAATAKLHGAEVVTGDKEFKQVEKEVRLHWIR